MAGIVTNRWSTRDDAQAEQHDEVSGWRTRSLQACLNYLKDYEQSFGNHFIVAPACADRVAVTVGHQWSRHKARSKESQSPAYLYKDAESSSNYILSNFAEAVAQPGPRTSMLV